MNSSKILVPDIAKRACFGIDLDGSYAFTSGYGIILKEIPESWLYILGLLNSKLLDFYIRRVSTPLRGGFFRYFTQYIEQLPVRRINLRLSQEKEAHDRVLGLVNKILAAKRADPAADISALEAEIDQLVYQLYGLTSEEIALVEESVKR